MNDVNFSKCKFSADIVPYMYGELPAFDISAFESHLIDCSDCTDEFASISSARYEVYDWKKLEFEPLATPRFVIPYEEVVKVSWVEKLRAAFSPGWALPTTALAALAITAVFAAVFVYRGDNEIARDSRNAAVLEPAPVNSPINETIQTTESRVDETAVQNPSPVRVVSPTHAESRRPTRTILPRPRSLDARPTQAKTQPALRLNEFTEDEDTSLRLAELLEDVETSD